MRNQIEHHPFQRLLWIILAAVIVRIIFFSGFVGFDDKYYILQSYTFFTGNFESAAHQFGPRIGASLVGAMFLSIFGPGKLAFVLFPFLCSIANIFLVYAIGRLLFAGTTTALAGATLIAFLPFEIIYSSLFYVDLILGTLLGAAVYMFLLGERRGKWYWFLSAGIFFGWAYLVKSTAIFLIPVLGLYALYKKRIKPAYLFAILGVLAVIGFELIFHEVNSGDAMFRRNILSERSAGIIAEQQADWDAYVDATVTSPVRTGNFYVDRWLIEPLLTLFGRPEFGLLFYIVIPAFLLMLLRRKSEGEIICMLWFGWILGFIIFGSINPKAYVPLATLFVSARYFTIIFIPAALLGGSLLSGLNKRWPLRSAIISLYVGVSILAVTFDATRFDKQIAADSYAAMLDNPGQRWIVDPNDYVGFLYFSNFEVLKDSVELLFPDGNRNSKTLKSIFLVKPNVTGYDSLNGQHQVFVSVDEKYLKAVNNKRVVLSIPNAKEQFRNQFLGLFLDPLGFDFSDRPVSERRIYYLE